MWYININRERKTTTLTTKYFTFKENAFSKNGGEKKKGCVISNLYLSSFLLGLFTIPWFVYVANWINGTLGTKIRDVV